MAQLPRGICSTFGFQCCLLFLLASWEAGATSQELQKSSESPAPLHASPFTPGLGHGAPTDHTTLHPGHRPSGFPKSTEVQRPKRHCNTTHRSRPTGKPGDNSGGTAQASPGAQPTPPPTSTQSKQEPAVREDLHKRADSTYIHKRSSQQLSTSAPARKTTCRSTTRKTRTTGSTATRARPVENTSISLNNTTITSHKNATTVLSSANSEISRNSTLSSERTTQATMTSYKGTKPPEKSDETEGHRTTVVSGNPLTTTTKDMKETSASKKTTGNHTIPPEHAGQTVAAHEVTGTHTPPPERRGQTVVAHEVTETHTTPPEHGGQTTAAHEVTGTHTTPPLEHGGQTMAAHEVAGTHTTPPERGGQTMVAHEVTGTHTAPPEHGGQTVVTHEVTGTHTTPPEHGEQATLMQEGTAETTEAQTMPLDHEEKATSAHKRTTSKSTEHAEETTSTTEKTTSVSKNPIENPKKTTLTTETMKTLMQSIKIPEITAAAPPAAETTRHTVTAAEDTPITVTSPHVKETEVTHRRPLGSLAPTPAGVHQSSTTSGAPGNKSQPQQTSDHTQTAPHASATGTQSSFPAWAIVVVVLLAVILLLLFIGLISVFCLSAASRRALARNAEDADEPDQEGPNSYPVYLMEQQNLGRGQVPFPQ